MGAGKRSSIDVLLQKEQPNDRKHRVQEAMGGDEYQPQDLLQQKKRGIDLRIALKVGIKLYQDNSRKGVLEIAFSC